MRRIFLPWIELRKDELDWEYLSSYIPDVNILEQNPEKINWNYIARNGYIENAWIFIEKN